MCKYQAIFCFLVIFLLGSCASTPPNPVNSETFAGVKKIGLMAVQPKLKVEYEGFQNKKSLPMVPHDEIREKKIIKKTMREINVPIMLKDTFIEKAYPSIRDKLIILDQEKWGSSDEDWDYLKMAENSDVDVICTPSAPMEQI